MPFPKLKLSYFDIEGRAEAARLAFFIGGVPFQDDRFPREEFAARRASCPYGVSPTLEVDGVVMAESSAIARYAGRLTGLYPSNNPVATLLIDEIMHVIDEFGERFRPWFIATEPEMKKQEETKLLRTEIPRYLRQIDAKLGFLENHVSFQDSNRLSIHEVWLYQFVRTLLQSDWLAFVPKGIVQDYPYWQQCITKVNSHPRVQEWLAIQPIRPRKLKLTYFAFGGRAEPIRLALFMGNVPFEDERLRDRDEFLKLQPSLPFNQVPTLQIDDGPTITQALAILRYAGTLSGLYPVSDDMLAFRIDEQFAVIDQLHNVWYPAFAEQDPAKQPQLRETLIQETLPKYLGGLDKRVAAWASPFATGNSLTVADLAIYGVLAFLQSGVIAFIPTDITKQFPHLTRIHDLVTEHPKVQAYYASQEGSQEP